jgi:hypothetical protein
MTISMGIVRRLGEALSDGHTILLLQLQEPHMSVLLPRVPVRREIRDLRPERARVFGERVQVQSVKHNVRHVAHC